MKHLKKNNNNKSAVIYKYDVYKYRLFLCIYMYVLGSLLYWTNKDNKENREEISKIYCVKDIALFTVKPSSLSLDTEYL